MATPPPRSQGSHTFSLEAQDSTRQYFRNKAATLWPCMSQAHRSQSDISTVPSWSKQSPVLPDSVGENTGEDQRIYGDVFKPSMGYKIVARIKQTPLYLLILLYVNMFLYATGF